MRIFSALYQLALSELQDTDLALTGHYWWEAMNS